MVLTFARSIRSTLVLALMLTLVSLTGGAPALAKDEPSTQQLLNALKKRSITSRGVTIDAPRRSASPDPLIKRLQGRTTRQISVEERTEVAKIAEDKPSVDLEILFAYDSAAIQPESVSSLANLGQALSHGELKGATFLIAGHTDATGSAPYNQALSERRADAVKNFLVRTYKIASRSLIAVGYGEENLKNFADPEAGENRRVQIVNLTP